jgi:small basic protein
MDAYTRWYKNPNESTRSGTAIKFLHWGFTALAILVIYGAMLTALGMPFNLDIPDASTTMYWMLFSASLFAAIVAVIWTLEHSFDIMILHYIFWFFMILLLALVALTASWVSHIYINPTIYPTCNTKLQCVGSGCVWPDIPAPLGAGGQPTVRCTALLSLSWIAVVFIIASIAFSLWFCINKWHGDVPEEQIPIFHPGQETPQAVPIEGRKATGRRRLY